MEVKERVEKIKNFFITLTVSDGAICIVVKFPDKWIIGETSELKKEFKVEVVSENGCYFFMTELENGFDTVFNCIDYIIETNRAIEEKSALLEAKAKELTDLFVKEPLERLKTLYFAFSEPTNGKRKQKKKAIETQENEPEQIIEETKQEQVEKIIDQVVNNDDISSIMEAAIRMTEG